MNSEEIQILKNKLTENHIIDILETLGATIYQNDNDMIISTTICHHGEKAKLYYYKETKLFHCYTECGSLDILEIICKNRGYKLHEAINWICIKFNFENSRSGFGEQKIISDWEFINGFKKSKNRTKNNKKKLECYDEKILNAFQPIYYQGWIDEGISIASMKKYDISYFTLQQKIIIPHYDIKNSLVGVRGRCLLEDDIEMFGKYSPLKIGDMIYKHPLSLNLYGINHNIQTIKRKRKVMLVEGEKGVLQADTLFGDENFTLALSGCSLSTYQKDFLIMLGLREVIIGFDKQYERFDSEEAQKWADHITKEIIKPLSPYMSVCVIWDTCDLLDYKNSPLDKGKETLLKLMKNKIYVGSTE